jgi:hypothetical protein
LVRRFSSQVESSKENSGSAEPLNNRETAVAKPLYKNIDTRPKHLLHLSAEDLIKPDAELMKSEMAELIKEARAKIKPVIKAMTDAELKSLIKTVKEVEGNKQIIINRPKFYEVLSKNGITLEELRKI